MTAHIEIAPTPAFQRARGLLTISAQKLPNSHSRLKGLRQQGSYRAIFPRPINGNVEAVLINTAGGVTGGDRFSTTITAHQNAKLSITTQAAERIYRARDRVPGYMEAKLSAESGSHLNWLPQETILFDGARLRRRLDVQLDRNAKFLMIEPLVFGREAASETLRSGMLDDSVSIKVDQKRVYFDRIKLEDDIASQLARPAVANGARAVANIVCVCPSAKTMLDPVRGLLPHSAGASLLSETILVVRILAVESFALRRALFPILTLLTGNAVPKNWRL